MAATGGKAEAGEVEVAVEEPSVTVEGVEGPERGGVQITVTTNLYKLLPSTTPVHSTSDICTPVHSTSSASTFGPASIPASLSSSSSSSSIASSLVIYSLVIREDGKSELDLPFPVRMQVVESLKGRYPEVFQGHVLSLGPGNTAYSLEDIIYAFNTKFLVLEAMLHYSLSLQMERRAGLYFPYTPACPHISLTPGRQVQMSYRACLTPASSLLLSLDVCQPVVTKAVSLLAFLRTDLGWQESDLHRPMMKNTRYELSLLLRDLKVRVTHSRVRRVYRVVEVAAKGADVILMYLHNQHSASTTRWTVEQYFLHFYGLSLRYPRLNCLHVAPKQRLIFLPLEVCELVGGQRLGSWGGGWSPERKYPWNPHQDPHRDRYWDLGPEERQKHIAALVRSPPLALDPALTRLGLRIEQEAVEVVGKVLPPPTLLASTRVVPEGGRWQLGQGVGLYKPATLHTWSLVQYDVQGLKRNTLHERFLQRLREVGRALGMDVRQPSVDVVRKATKPLDDLVALLRYYPYSQLTLFLMRPGVPYLHEDTKHAGNFILEHVTQCVAPDTYRDKLQDDQVMTSLLLQMNAKCGGVSVALDWPALLPASTLMCKPVLVVGAAMDGHPKNFPRSAFLAAMVGMMAREGGPCVTLVHPQHRQHCIANTASNFERLLLRYYETNHTKPQSLLVYRLDLPQEELERVTAWEATEIRRACSGMQVDGEYQPPITYVWVSRSHHTRLFRGPGGGGGNIPPGTVVEGDIIHPSIRGFFLSSHLSDSGTTRPTEYRVVYDDNHLGLDELQTVTYALCHLHASCSQAVSLPAPAAYARQAAKFARQIASRQEGHVAQLDELYDPVPLVTLTSTMDHYNTLHTKLYYL
ncbi:protein argonaute-4-like isoform X2 [Scylla paramamosain]|uniref:protein argonaute-4-like isoform X2 n=1 Tax=Scylla paramamosain TaxID=85552 RepID=UPI0030831F6A